MIYFGRSCIVLSFAASCCAQPSSGVIRIWGSTQMLALVEKWERAFSKHRPDVRFENHLYGAASAIAGLYTGVADIVFSREIWPIETLAFQQVLGYEPEAVEVATGSFDVPTKSDSLDIFVHKDNPISGLTLAQLGLIFASHGVSCWGDLGLKGEWTGAGINTYGYKLDNAGMMLFASIVMKDGATWNGNVRAFGNRTEPGKARVDAGTLILDALAKDEYGIAISNAHYARPEVKMLPIAKDSSGPNVLPSRETVRNRTYPLTRRVYAFLRRSPDPKVREFLRYILSRDGQEDVVEEGDYLPLMGVHRAFRIAVLASVH